MKLTIQRVMVIAGLITVAGVSATAVAQGMVPGSHHPHEGHQAALHQEHRGQNHQQQLDQLKSALKLAPNQEAAWNAFVARTDTATHTSAGKSSEKWSDLTTPQRLDRMQSIHAEHDAQLKRRADATRSFYATLTAEQQKIFDDKDSVLQLNGHKWRQRMHAGALRGQHHHQPVGTSGAGHTVSIGQQPRS